MTNEFVARMNAKILSNAFVAFIASALPLKEYGIRAEQAFEIYLLRLRSGDTEFGGYMQRRELYQQTFGSLTTPTGYMFESIGIEIEVRLLELLTVEDL